MGGVDYSINTDDKSR